MTRRSLPTDGRGQCADRLTDHGAGAGRLHHRHHVLAGEVGVRGAIVRWHVGRRPLRHKVFCCLRDEWFRIGRHL